MLQVVVVVSVVEPSALVVFVVVDVHPASAEIPPEIASISIIFNSRITTPVNEIKTSHRCKITANQVLQKNKWLCQDISFQKSYLILQSQSPGSATRSTLPNLGKH